MVVNERIYLCSTPATHVPDNLEQRSVHGIITITSVVVHPCGEVWITSLVPLDKKSAISPTDWELDTSRWE